MKNRKVNKKKKAFTLIELLAIIVILAIIAVITVPIILNIIENSKKGAATNSAYGYKDAIEKFYASKLTLDKNYNISDGIHTKQDFDNMGVTYSGKAPLENSFLKTYKNRVIQGCLQFDEYKVEFVDGELINTSKGECKTINVVYTDTNENEIIDLSDTVKIGDEEFYIIEYPANGKVKLLPKYNLNANSRQENAYTPRNEGWIYNLDDNDNDVAFSTANYWDENLSNYEFDTYNTHYIYTRNTSNNLYTYIENYKRYLLEMGAYFVADARLMTYTEARGTGCKDYDETGYSTSCPDYIANQNYWLGTENDGADTVKVISKYLYNYGLKRHISNEGYGEINGVRPLIEIYESAITNEYTIKFDSRGGGDVADIKIATGSSIGTLPSNLVKEGATFEGWYTDKEYNEKISADTVPIGSTTYYARYVLSKAEYTDSNESGTIDLGDKVKILDDYFYVIAAPADGKVKLLAEYNLNANSRQENGRVPSNTGWANSIYNNDNNVPFSDENYWENNLTNYSKDANNLYYVYRTSDGEETTNNLVGYIKAYQSYLNRLGAEYIIDARLMSYEEARATGCKVYDESGYSASCPTYIANQTYWLGSRNNNNGTLKTVSYYIYNYGRKRHMGSNAYNEANTNGVRPLIIINESALTN